jgi:hypothetical protein
MAVLVVVVVVGVVVVARCRRRGPTAAVNPALAHARDATTSPIKSAQID